MLWQVLFCMVALASAAPRWDSLEDDDHYFFGPAQHRFVSRPFVRAFQGVGQAAPSPTFKSASNVGADVTHVKQTKTHAAPARVLYKVDFDDDDDDDRVFFSHFPKFRSAPRTYSAGRPGGFFRYFDDDFFDFDDK